jgi:hypothetical protein
MTKKEFLAVVYAINKFCHYITGYPTFVHTIIQLIKYLVNKPVINGRIIRWLLLLQEFDITILDKPGRENVVADFLSQIPSDRVDEPMDDSFPDEHLFSCVCDHTMVCNIANYLVAGRLPQHFSYRERCALVKKSGPFTWIKGYLFKLGPDQILQRCVREDEVYEILKACHDEPCGGNFVATRTAKNILSTSYYWPTLHKDAKAYVRHCDACQRMGQPTKSEEIPLQPHISLEPFEKWGIDFVGPINPPSNQFKYILVCIDYLTKWVEVEPLKNIQEKRVVEFLYDNIFTRFGVPREIVSDRGAQFTSKLIADLMDLYKIRHRKTTTYHPQANGQVEVTNRELENILTKTVQFHHRDWENKLSEVVWAYRTTWKTSTRFTPYELVYGKTMFFQ